GARRLIEIRTAVRESGRRVEKKGGSAGMRFPDCRPFPWRLTPPRTAGRPAVFARAAYCCASGRRPRPPSRTASGRWCRRECVGFPAARALGSSALRATASALGWYGLLKSKPSAATLDFPPRRRGAAARSGAGLATGAGGETVADEGA